ncbi:hypothetical protein CAEBREN_19254 [Caenorhabditis brenneri]|uniref:Uncharacterized protein n=1 Tax=Caenorhabditis brenneri TaxID=135651 RepID=G0M7G8_CAEBE|nr:hypothetical protein CAEBREN_19254 [Caenorhabditis brenneri]
MQSNFSIVALAALGNCEVDYYSTFLEMMQTNITSEKPIQGQKNVYVHYDNFYEKDRFNRSFITCKDSSYGSLRCYVPSSKIIPTCQIERKTNQLKYSCEHLEETAKTRCGEECVFENSSSTYCCCTRNRCNFKFGVATKNINLLDTLFVTP